jgi:hypothetical protein
MKVSIFFFWTSVSAIILFGDPFTPVLLALRFFPRFEVWFLPLIISLYVSNYMLQKFKIADFTSYHAKNYQLTVFAVIFMFLFFGLTAVIVDTWKAIKIYRINADEYIFNPFIASSHEAPREFQFFVHAAVLKDCKTYAWSHWQMGFFELPPNVAKNVVPNEWTQKCQMRFNP